MKIRITGKVNRMSDFAAVLDEYRYNGLVTEDKIEFEKFKCLDKGKKIFQYGKN